MAQLDQIQISYVAAEDRLMLRVSTSAAEEFRFWMTRRYVKLLRPQLRQHLGQQVHIQTQASPVAQRELLEFERQQAVQGADFKTPYRASEKQLPLGEAPVLLTRFALGKRKDGALILALSPAAGQGVDLALNAQLLHSLVALIDSSLKAAEWALDTVAAEKAEAAIEAPSTIN